MSVPYCCAAAEFDGFTPEEHAPHCREPRPAPDASGRDRTISDAPTLLNGPTRTETPDAAEH